MLEMIKRFLLLTMFLLFAFVLTGCSSAGKREKVPTLELPLYGFSFSPKDSSASSFLSFFSETKKVGSAVTWAGDWNELSKKSSAPYSILNQAPRYGYEPIILVGYYNQGAGTMIREFTDETKENYKRSTLELVSDYKPAYFAMGVEVNIMREKSPKEFSEFVDFYNEMYDEIKAVSAETKVFTVFQLERMKGLKGGLFGGKNDTSKTEWDILEQFKLDLVGFTTYPDIIYSKPESIPSDYYSEISKHTSKPIGFFESGWHTSPFPKGYEGSEEKQAAFVKRFLNDTKALNSEVIIWSFLYDAETDPPFDSTGLIGDDETKRLGYDEWKNLIN